MYGYTVKQFHIKLSSKMLTTTNLNHNYICGLKHNTHRREFRLMLKVIIDLMSKIYLNDGS